VPLGTLVRDAETGRLICDVFEDEEKVMVAKGGNGCKGNVRFTTARRHAPNFAQKGEKVKPHEVILEMKVIADVGLVGFPNVGKSTLLSKISAAKPKIANYHFTTLSPNLGVVGYYDKSFVMADIPGLIEGASEGLGLGHSFLRHIERTRILVHVLDISGSEERNPIDDFNLINNEIFSYDEKLRDIPMIVVANKMDMPNAEENLAKFVAEFGDRYKIIPMTTIIHEGAEELLKEIIDVLEDLPPVQQLQFEPFSYDEGDDDSFEVVKLDPATYEVIGGLVTILSRKVNIDDIDSFRYFQRVIKEKGVIAELRKAGAGDGDTVIIGEIEFDFID
jgi:GTP-binding protein